MSAGDSAGDASARLNRHVRELRDRADRAEARAQKFEKGRQGELVVAAELERLRAHGYGYAADVRWPGTTRANVDFLVFGPAGAFVIDAKNWSGNVTVSRGVLRQNSYRRDREVDKVQRMAQDLDALLGAHPGTCRPLICLVGQPALPITQCGATYVLGVGGLVTWLAHTPIYWDAERISAIADWLPSVLAPAGTGRSITVLPPTGVHLPAPASRLASTGGPESQQPASQRGRHRRQDMGLYGHLR